ncbi:MAG: hypothetical protein Fur0037_22370 [Planctomycetota bacterium]
MDEISREPLGDKTTRGGGDHKGPPEAALFERGIAAESLLSERPRPRADGAPRDRFGEPASGEDSALVSAEEARAAAAEAESKALVEEDVEIQEEHEGLPAVPAIESDADLARIAFVLMMTQREGLSLLRLAQACDTTQKRIEGALDLLCSWIAERGLPLELARTGDTVRWLCSPETFPYLQRLWGVKKLEKLSSAALETLSVIAYRQPVMRSEIEAIRGVKAGPMLRTLLHHKLIRVTGRADVPGRPLQYGTTQQFLDRFGLRSLQDLPSEKEYKQL